MNGLKRRLFGPPIRLARKSVAGLKKTYYAIARRFVHQLFRSVFEDPIVAWKPDVVHVHDGLSLPLGASAAKRSGAHMVFDSHELEAHRNPPLSAWQKRNVERIERRYLPKADAVTTVGHKISQYLASTYAIAPPEVIYNAPPISHRPLPEKWQQPARGALRAEAGIPKDAVVLVYTGNITINRGIEQMLDGLAYYLNEHGPSADIYLSMVGKTRPETREAIIARADELGLLSRINFHDPVSPTAVVEFISDGNIAVIPVIPATLSYDYAMPNKLFESMMAGLPILGTRLAEMAPFIEKHALGLCYTANSASGFSEALAQLLKDGQPRRFSEERRQELARMFGWEAQERVLLNVYAGLGTPEGPLRIAMVVPNPCDPDYRVVKQAETLAGAGHRVCVFCTRPTGSDLPDEEVINAVTYRRLDWSTRTAANGFLRFHGRQLSAKLKPHPKLAQS